jgi:hypothetical protein
MGGRGTAPTDRQGRDRCSLIAVRQSPKPGRASYGGAVRAAGFKPVPAVKKR